MAKTQWDVAVESVVRRIPRGGWLSYGEVAALAGRPGGAKAVVRALNRLERIPWWRVVRSDGTLAPQVAVAQAKRLRQEGVHVTRANGRWSIGRRNAK